MGLLLLFCMFVLNIIIMKVKLLKRLRKKAYLERLGGCYRACFNATFFSSVSSPLFETRKEAENQLRYYILICARLEFKRPKIKMYSKSKKNTNKLQCNMIKVNGCMHCSEVFSKATEIYKRETLLCRNCSLKLFERMHSGIYKSDIESCKNRAIKRMERIKKEL